MIKAIIFDCFGVLVTDALQITTDKLRRSNPAVAQQIREIIAINNRGLVEPAESSRQVAKLLGITVEQYRQQIADGEVKNVELLAYIRSLRPQYKTAMLSNIGVGSLARRFTEQELTDHFDEVVASGEIGYAKPEPEAYEITAERLGVRLDECVFTDDHEMYCEGARAIGMQSILFKDLTEFRATLESLLPK